jgi:hypothetical protein
MAQVQVLWDLMLCRSANGSRLYRGSYHPHVKRLLMKANDPSKRRELLTQRYNVAPQKTLNLNRTSVRTSIHSYQVYCLLGCDTV